jgi:hypothetical protein
MWMTLVIDEFSVIAWKLLLVPGNTQQNGSPIFGTCQSKLNYRTNNTTLHTFNVDNKNQLTSTTLGGTCAYDFNGNLTSDQTGARTYAYDDENQLLQRG